MDCGANFWVGTTTAQVALHGVIDVLIRGGGVICQQISSLHDLSGLTVTALGDLVVDPRLLDDREVVGGAEPFDCGHIAPNIRKGHLARPHGLAINMHGAGATGRHAAAEFSASEANGVAQNPKQGHVVGEVNCVGFSVYG